jgi:hypothetical protein
LRAHSAYQSCFSLAKSGAVEASDFFNHAAPHRNASPHTLHVSRVMHRGQHPVASTNVVWNEARLSIVLGGLDATKNNRDFGVRGED